MSDKQKARIENWSKFASDYLVGDVYGHPKLTDGSHIRTSRIEKMDEKECVTKNTVYTLGKPFDHYIRKPQDREIEL